MLVVDGRRYELQAAFVAERRLAALVYPPDHDFGGGGSWDQLRADVQAFEAASPGGNLAGLGQFVAWSSAVVRALLARHHPDATQDEVDEILDHLGSPAEAVSAGLALYQLWLLVDRLGVYVAGGGDPTVTLGEGETARTLALRFRAKAIRHLAEHLDGRAETTLRDYEAITTGALLRHHAEAAVDAGTVDDVAWRVGIAGLARLMGGAEQPKRPAAAGGEPDPNAPAPGGDSGEPRTGATSN